MSRTWFFAMLLFACGCGNRDEPPRKPAPSNMPRPVSPASSSPAPAVDTRPAIVCFGDSITAGFGLEPGEDYPDLLQKDLDRRGLKYRVVNMGVSGDTTQDGLSRLSLASNEKPAIVVLELGANDGLRGVPTDIIQTNLAQMIEAFQSAGARVILAGMTLPPNYGPQYIARFDKVYSDLASKYEVTLIPFLLAGVGGHSDFMQKDGLHPNAAGARKIETLVVKTLEGMLNRGG
jgi:acyl-CoA thioesterase-1